MDKVEETNRQIMFIVFVIGFPVLAVLFDIVLDILTGSYDISQYLAVYVLTTIVSVCFMFFAMGGGATGSYEEEIKKHNKFF